MFILLAFIGGIVFAYLSPKIFVAPSCSDMKQNGDETGVDCGGSCTLVCSAEAKDPVVLWSRAFQVTGSIYNVAAYIENQTGTANQALPYEFRVYDTNDVLVTRVQGTTIVPPSGRYAIVETGLNVGTAQVGRVTFVFGSPHPAWQRISESVQAIRLAVQNVSIVDIDTVPKVLASLVNPSSTVTFRNTSIAVILYDKDDNAINVSKTFVPEVAAGQTVPIFFTWPQPLTATVARYEFLPIIDVFNTK